MCYLITTEIKCTTEIHSSATNNITAKKDTPELYLYGATGMHNSNSHFSPITQVHMQVVQSATVVCKVP